MAGSKGTNPTLLMAECLHCFESGTRKVHVARCSSHARCVKLGLWLRARCSGRRTLGASLSPNRTGFFFQRCCMKIINHRNRKKEMFGFSEFFVDSGWQGRSISQSAVSQSGGGRVRKMAGRRRAKDCYSRVDIVETIKVLQHAIAEA